MRVDARFAPFLHPEDLLANVVIDDVRGYEGMPVCDDIDC
jgi:hypothetical protein